MDNGARESKGIEFLKWKVFPQKYPSILVEEMYVCIVFGFFKHLSICVHTAWKSEVSSLLSPA